MVHRVLFLSGLSLLARVGFGQNTYNTNQGVIINSTVIVADPVYVPVAPAGPALNIVERRMQDMQRKQQLEEMDRQNRIRARSYEREDFMLTFAERDDKRYEARPTYITTQAVNMRTEGGTQNPIIRQLPKGTVVKVVEGGSIFTAGWWEIHVPGTEGTGYVHPKFLKSPI